MLSVYHMTAFTIGFVMDLLFGDRTGCGIRSGGSGA